MLSITNTFFFFVAEEEEGGFKRLIPDVEDGGVPCNCWNSNLSSLFNERLRWMRTLFVDEEEDGGFLSGFISIYINGY